MPAVTVASLVASLRSLRLLEPAQEQEVTRVAGRCRDPRELAKLLLQRGWVTPFQLNHLLQGKTSDLVLGSYILLERLGEGGMGQVFKAKHQAMGRIVAVKLLQKDLLTRIDAVKRFRREIQLVATLSHPNIVLAFDADLVGQAHYLAMEYVEGIDLGRLVKSRGPLPVRDACDYIRQAALGLQHAHEKGLVHRDIKPTNLLRANQGNVVKVLDLGLARLREGEDDGLSGSVENASSENGPTQLTYAGRIVGTPDFIAPEQARDSRSVDIRADLYSLGCTFFFLLAGYPPFRGDTALEKLVKHQTEPPPVLEKVRPDVPASVAAVVKQLMAKLPEQRFQTPGVLAAALATFQNPTPLPSGLSLATGARRTGIVPGPVMAAAASAVPTAVPVARPAAPPAVSEWNWTDEPTAPAPRSSGSGLWSILGFLGVALLLLSGMSFVAAKLGLFNPKMWTDAPKPTATAPAVTSGPSKPK